MQKSISIIGAGLAGCEVALQLAKYGIPTVLYEQKPLVKSPAHSLDTFAELVCSNSLKSLDPYTASGLLKQELLALDCILIVQAFQQGIPAGSALAVDRTQFSQTITSLVQSNPLITIKNQVVETLDLTPDHITVLATGPLTDGKLYEQLQNLCGNSLNFFDAVSPIVSKDSLDMDYCFVADRYNKSAEPQNNAPPVSPLSQDNNINNKLSQSRLSTSPITPSSNGSYINCVLNKEEYLAFYNALITAQKVQKKEWENIQYFESCMPIETIASRGVDTMRFGPMRPVGILDPRTGKRPYAVLQLRQENASANMYNLVGFQTALQWSEQKRVFGIIPALKNAEYLRYGVMHRNSYINSPQLLTPTLSLQSHPNLFIIGQLCGVEGYVESIMTGLVAAHSILAQIQNLNPSNHPNLSPTFDKNTIIGSLLSYITTPTTNFAPMNANFGILPPLNHIRNKDERKKAYYDRSIASIYQSCPNI